MWYLRLCLTLLLTITFSERYIPCLQRRGLNTHIPRITTPIPILPLVCHYVAVGLQLLFREYGSYFRFWKTNVDNKVVFILLYLPLFSLISIWFQSEKFIFRKLLVYCLTWLRTKKTVLQSVVNFMFPTQGPKMKRISFTYTIHVNSKDSLSKYFLVLKMLAPQGCFVKKIKKIKN